MSKRTIWITLNSQTWTDEDPENLVEDLEGADDKVLRFEIGNSDDNFAIVTRNGKTYKLFDYFHQADDFWQNQYKDYEFCLAVDSGYFVVNDPKIGYDSEQDAVEDGCFNTVFINRGETYIVYQGRIVCHNFSKEVLYEWMYQHKGVKYEVLN